MGERGRSSRAVDHSGNSSSCGFPRDVFGEGTVLDIWWQFGYRKDEDRTGQDRTGQAAAAGVGCVRWTTGVSYSCHAGTREMSG